MFVTAFCVCCGVHVSRLTSTLLIGLCRVSFCVLVLAIDLALLCLCSLACLAGGERTRTMHVGSCVHVVAMDVMLGSLASICARIRLSNDDTCTSIHFELWVCGGFVCCTCACACAGADGMSRTSHTRVQVSFSMYGWIGMGHGHSYS
jgi:hypothetical protein